MLGGEIKDPHGVEAEAQGLGLLPYRTEFQRQKRYRHSAHTLAPLSGFWAPLSGIDFDGYEIRHGRSVPSALDSSASLHRVLGDDCGWQHGETLALYPHGLFESPVVMRALFGRNTRTLDDTLNGLADFVDAHFAPGILRSFVAS
jgi:adenosylcobyric acid synthase